MDLLQIHHFDKDIPIEETIEALHDLMRMGKVRYISGSSMRTYQFAMIQSCTKAHDWTKIRQHAEPYDLSELSQCQSLSLSFDMTRDIKPDISLLNDTAGVCKVGGGFCSYQARIFSHWVCIDNGWCSSKGSTISVSTDETCETVGSDYNRAVVPSNSTDWRVTPKALPIGPLSVSVPERRTYSLTILIVMIVCDIVKISVMALALYVRERKTRTASRR
jgi:hypothetical protein